MSFFSWPPARGASRSRYIVVEDHPEGHTVSNNLLANHKSALASSLFYSVAASTLVFFSCAGLSFFHVGVEPDTQGQGRAPMRPWAMAGKYRDRTMSYSRVRSAACPRVHVLTTWCLVSSPAVTSLRFTTNCGRSVKPPRLRAAGLWTVTAPTAFTSRSR